jgi:hypothetical protein
VVAMLNSMMRSRKNETTDSSFWSLISISSTPRCFHDRAMIRAAMMGEQHQCGNLHVS